MLTARLRTKTVLSLWENSYLASVSTNKNTVFHTAALFYSTSTINYTVLGFLGWHSSSITLQRILSAQIPKKDCLIGKITKTKTPEWHLFPGLFLFSLGSKS